jgi:hypothetical protein
MLIIADRELSLSDMSDIDRVHKNKGDLEEGKQVLKLNKRLGPAPPTALLSLSY